MINLKLILKQYPNCLSSRASFKSVLMDTYPDEKRTINILTIMFECGIVPKIKSKTVLGDNEFHAILLQLENDYGIISTYDIISKVAYLIGVPKHIFENEHEPPKLEIYEALDKNKSARIVRNLCVVRAAIERRFGKINDAIRKDFKSIYTLPELIPQDSLRQLELDGANFYKKSSTKLGHHIIEINKLIRDRINNCKDIFPVLRSTLQNNVSKGSVQAMQAPAWALSGCIFLMPRFTSTGEEDAFIR